MDWKNAQERSKVISVERPERSDYAILKIESIGDGLKQVCIAAQKSDVDSFSFILTLGDLYELTAQALRASSEKVELKNHIK